MQDRNTFGRNFFIMGVFGGLLLSAFAANASLFSNTTVTHFSAGPISNVLITDIGGGDGDVSVLFGSITSDQMQTASSTKQGFDNKNLLAQTFTAGHSGFLHDAILSLDRNNSSNTDGQITVEIRAASSGVPTTTVLASATISALSVNRNGARDYDFIFASPPAMASGTVYAIVVHRSGSGTITANFNWYSGSTSSDQYANGGRYSINEGAPHPAWALQTIGKGDLRFQTFYQDYTSGTIGSSVLDTATTTTRYNSLSWSETVPSGTDITFKVRASNTLFAAGDASPSWTSLGSLNSPINLSAYLASSYRYFQWQATLMGAGTTTPILHDATVMYNRPPIAQRQTVATDEDTPIEITLGGSDLDGDTLSYGTSTSPSHGTLSAISGNHVTYTPAANYFGADFFDFKTSDGTVQSAAMTVSITVNSVNDAPVVNAVTLTPILPKTNDTLTANVSASDVEGDTLTYAYQWKKNDVDISGATGSSLDLSAAGNGDKGDIISVAVTASDPHGGVSSPFTSSGVTIVNTSPTASNQSISLDEDTSAVITLAATDADTGDSLTYEIVNNPNPAMGSLSAVSGNHVTYTPVANAHGVDSFTYRASDGTNVSSEATVNLTINSVDDPVVLAHIGNKEVNELETLAFTASASDVDAGSGTIVYSLISAPTGAAINSETGKFSWTPTEAQGPGDYTFTVRAAFSAVSDEESITVTVHEVNQDPIAHASDVLGLANASTTVIVSGEDADVPAQTLTFFVVDTPSHGVLGEFSGTDVIYAPISGYSGYDTFTYRAFDGVAYSTTATATLTIIAAPSPSPLAGSYSSAQSVFLTALGASEIRYTTDNTDPSCITGTVYGSPISVAQSKTIRAIACFGSHASSVNSSFYAINWNIDSSAIADLWTNDVFTTADSTSSASTTAINVNQAVSINMQMGSGTSTIELPAGTVISQIGGGSFSASDLNARITAPGAVVVSSSDTLIVSLEWGIPNIALQFSNPVTMHIFVGGSFNGQTLNVARSISGTSDWTTDGIGAPATCVVDQGICTVSVTKASFYAVTTPVIVATSNSSGNSSSGSSSGSNSGGGGGGGGGGYMSTGNPSPQGYALSPVASTTPTAAPSPVASAVPSPTAAPILADREVTSLTAQAEHTPNATPRITLKNNSVARGEATQTIQSPNPEATPDKAKEGLRQDSQQQKSLFASVANVITFGTGSLLVAIGVLLIIGSVSTFLYMRFF